MHFRITAAHTAEGEGEDKREKQNEVHHLSSDELNVGGPERSLHT